MQHYYASVKEYVLQVAERMSPSTVQTEGMLAWALQ